MEGPPDFKPLFRLLRDALIACVLIVAFCYLVLKFAESR
jgi:hypothetical protein